LDDGAAFTGDLTRLALATDEARRELELSWRKIQEQYLITVFGIKHSQTY
jgi:hypothetical protein